MSRLEQFTIEDRKYMKTFVQSIIAFSLLVMLACVMLKVSKPAPQEPVKLKGEDDALGIYGYGRITNYKKLPYFQTEQEYAQFADKNEKDRWETELRAHYLNKLRDQQLKYMKQWYDAELERLRLNQGFYSSHCRHSRNNYCDTCTLRNFYR